jgi:endonuclease/exonuclease/phosphatase family metal-dependent hydrolase
MIVATWNLENLFRPGGDFGPRTEAAYRVKLDALSAVLRDVAPDVLAVQEVGEPAALDDLLARAGGTWHVELSDHPDGRGIRVGFASRLPLERAHRFTAFPRPMAPVQADDAGATVREMGRGGIAVRAASLDLLTCHLKSKLLSFAPGRFAPRDEGERGRFAAYALFRRAAEAAAVRSRADALLDGHGTERPVVLLGDFNDEPEAQTTQLLLGPPGSEIGTAGFDRPDKGDGMRLWNLAPLLPPERRFTRVYRTRRELIDHILVSRALVGRVVRADSIGELPSVGDVPTERRDAAGSDHALLLAEIDVSA